MSSLPKSWFEPKRPTPWWEPDKLPGDEPFPILKFLANADQRIFRRFGGLRRLSALLLLIAGLVILAPQLLALARGWRSEGWPVTQGEIVSRRSSPEPGVTYQYTVAGQTYRGEQVTLWSKDLRAGRGSSRDLPSDLPSALPAGTIVEVHYNPEHPAEAVLAPGPDLWRRCAIGACGVIPIALALVVWLTKIDWQTVYGSGPQKV